MKPVRLVVSTLVSALTLTMIGASLASAATPAAVVPSVWTPPVAPASCQTKVSDMPALCVTLEDLDGTHNTQTYLDANKENTIPAAINLTDPTNSANNLSSAGLEASEIHGRGNSTWALPKKAYQIKFAAKTSVLGMTKAKKWVLLANHTDPTLMRNAVALSLGKAIGLDNSPDYSYVDLFINGAYRGNYMVTEKAEIGDGRLTKTSNQQVMIEMDNNHYDEEAYSATVPSGSHIVLKDAAGSGGVPDLVPGGSPLPLTTDVSAGWEAAKAKFSQLDTLLTTPSMATGKTDWAAISAIIDVDSFLKVYWVEEVAENFDLPKSSVYFWIDPATDNKIHAGPIWDFDMTLGNFPSSAEQRGGVAAADYARNAMFYRYGDTHKVINPWYALLYRNQEFAAQANTLYSAKVTGALAQLSPLMNTLQARLTQSAAANFARWSVLGQTSYIAPTRTFASSWAGEISSLRSYVTSRKAYLDSTNGADFPLLQAGGFVRGNGWNPITKNDTAGNLTGSSQEATVETSQFIGMPGVSMPLTALRLNLVSPMAGELTANVSFVGTGWTGYRAAGHTGVTPWTSWPQIGTEGGNAIEAVQLKLSGDLANYFDVQYRANVISKGWQGWVTAGSTAGTTGQSLSVEALQVRLVKKGTVGLILTASSHQVSTTVQVTLTAKTWPAAPGVAVTFTTSTGVTLGSATTDGTGVATLTTTMPWAGEHDVTATLASPAASATTHVSVLNTLSVDDPRGLYHPVDPVRILDTRVGNGASGAIAAGKEVVLKVTGRGTVPSAGVGAVVLNLTVTGASQPGVVTVFPSGSAAPLASNLNYAAGQTIANLVLAKPGPDGSIVLRNGSNGTIHLIADVAGYELTATATTPGALLALTPSRILDTRDGTGATAGIVAASGTVDLAVTGHGGVPATGVSAVMLNMTVTQPSSEGHISAAAAGGTANDASNLSFAAGQTVANLVMVKVGANGHVTLANSSTGTTHVVADVAGYVVAGDPIAAGGVIPLPSARVLDTRDGTGVAAAAVPAGGDVVLKLTGVGGIPTSGVSAVSYSLTVTGATNAGFVTAYPKGGSAPMASNVNFVAGVTATNMAITKLGADGSIVLHNGGSATIQVFVDVNGYVSSGTSPVAGTFVATDPVRLLDTRVDNGYTGVVPAGADVVLRIAGRGPIPATGVGGVSLNVTVTAPTAAGVVTAYPSGVAAPLASNLNFVAGATVANLVVVRLGSDGSVVLHNGSSGTIHLIADVTGYYVGGTPVAPGAVVGLTPFRLLDTRDGTGVSSAGAVAGGADVVLKVAGLGGVPASGASAVLLNVTVTAPTTAGHITVFPKGGTAPVTSNLNFSAGQTIPNLVLAKIGADGSVVLRNGGTGTVQIIADVAGYVIDGSPVALGGLTAMSPVRVLDTRDGTGVGSAGTVPAGGDISLTIAGGVPTGASAVVLNVTVTGPSRDGYVTVYPSGSVAPNASNVNFTAGSTVPNLVMVAIGPDGKVAFHNGSAGTIALIADVAGWYS